jgi:hypothetical protein
MERTSPHHGRMPQVQIITPGDDLALVQDLYENGLLVDVSAATINAAIQDSFGNILIASTSQSSSASGAAWATGRVVCEFTSAQSAVLSRGNAWLEIEVIRSAKRTTWPLIPLDVQATAIT